MFRRFVATATFAGLAGAIGLSIGWAILADGARLEAVIQTLGLLAALTGIAAERLAAERQRRRLAQFALADELSKNQAIIADLRLTLGGTSRRRVYPRLLISAADGAITSGVLAGGNRHLFALLHEWRNEVTDFNRRLDLTEMLTFLQGTPDIIRDFEQALARDDGRLHRVADLLANLLDHLHQHHGQDSSWAKGIARMRVAVKA
jgi:hypothetical protein